MMTSTSLPADVRTQRLLVLGLCFATIVFDGYDLIVYGSVVPDLLEYEPWGLTPQRVGNIGSLALAGMLIGALAVGTLTDLMGGRKVLLGCTGLVLPGHGRLRPRPQRGRLCRLPVPGRPRPGRRHANHGGPHRRSLSARPIASTGTTP